VATFRLFKIHLRVPFLTLALIESLLCIAAVFAAVHIRFGGELSAESLARNNVYSPVLSALSFGIIMPVTMMAMGLYQARFRGGISGVLLRSISGFFAGAVFLALLYYVFPSLYIGRGVFGIALLLSFIGVTLLRPLFFYYVEKDVLKMRVLVLGAGERANSITQRLRRKVDHRGFDIVGYAPVKTDSKTLIEENKLIHLDGTLLEFCVENKIDEIVVAPDERRKGLMLNDLLDCKLHGIAVIDILSFFEREQGKLPLDIMRPDWLIYSDGFSKGTLRDISKRTFDIVASLLILAITWPFMLMAIIGIKLEDGFGAPVIYRQVRVGFLGAPFSVLKFRSMTVDAEKNGAQWASKNDARVTRMGSFMRVTRIDELPQILNVLKGDMSFVGPRPERPEFVENLTEQITNYKERHAVKPGITGWAQVCYPYGASLKDSIQKQEFDLFYIKNHTMFLDVLILCQTAEVVLFGKGAR
jgi:sugar transferase (PEP-CTERM system associated)